MMNHIQKQVFLFFSWVLLSCISSPVYSLVSYGYESYLTSWDPDFQQIAQSLQLPGLKEEKTTVINIAFGDFTFQEQDGIVIGGVGVSMQELQDVVNVLHQKGYLVKMSFGGGGCKVAPLLQNENDATNLANSISQAIKAYDFDGVDLDIEDWNVNADLEISMIKQIRSNLGDDAIISLTVPGNAFFDPVQDAISGSKSYVDYFNFMEYGITLENGNSFEEQVMQNLVKYLNVFQIPPGQVSLGFYPDKSDPSSYISVEALHSLLLEIANAHGGPWYAHRIMLWNLDLDSKQAIRR